MDKYTKVTPQGSRDYLFEESDDRCRIENILSNIYKQHSYRRVITSAMEFLDVFKNSESINIDDMYKFEDESGRATVLRPDNTLPIARLVASRLDDSEFPVRLCYNQNIYVRGNKEDGSAHEIAQSGIELIGLSGIEADIEVISIALESIKNVGLQSFKLEIGHSGFLNAVLDDMDIKKEQKLEICKLIETKNYAALSDLLNEIGDTAETELLHRIPRLFGGIEVLDEAKKIYKSKKSNESLEYLRVLYGKLSEIGIKDNIIIDLSIANRTDYYTGVIFKGYAEGLGVNVLSGGRYDKLLSEFGKDEPAIGFAFDVNSLCDVINEKINIERPIRIALTKGRLERNVVNIFKTMGLDTSELEKKGRRLILPVEDYEVVLSKAGDVITYVEHGVCDIGIVGKDTILENRGSFYEVLDLNIGKCKFALATLDVNDIFSSHRRLTIASKYPNVAKEYFKSKGMDVNIIKINGSVELAPLLGLADGIVDIVETGATLRENGLKVVEYIMPVSARVIVNTASMKLHKDKIESFLNDIEIASHV